MITSILEQFLIAFPLILGGYITISLFKLPDFSLESGYLFGAVSAYLLKDFDLPLIILFSAAGGALAGICTYILNQAMNIPYLLATIVTNGLFHGLTQYLLGTSNVSFNIHFEHEMTLFLGIGLFLAVAVGFFFHSQLGYCFSIYGNNPQFFSHLGISSHFVLLMGILLGYGCAGISGFLFAQSNGFVDLTMNYGIILVCLSSIMLGKLLIRSEKGNILVPLAGALMFFLIQQSLLKTGLNLKYFNAFQAMVILCVLSINFRKKKMTLLGV